MRACKYVWSCVYDIHTSTRIQKGIILDSGHGLVTVPPWALQFALYFGVGTNCLVLGSIAVGRYVYMFSVCVFVCVYG